MLTASPLSRAHQLSRPAIIDPIYDFASLAPAGEWLSDRAPWIYGHGELEAWRHGLLRERGLRAMGGELTYPGAFHTPLADASFRPRIAVEEETIRFRAVGSVTVFWHGQQIFEALAAEKVHECPLPQGSGELQIDLRTTGEPPALLVEEGHFRTDAGWEWRGGTAQWEPAVAQGYHLSGLPSHCIDEPEVRLEPMERKSDLFDFGRELFARPVVVCSKIPKLHVGESEPEARNDGSLRSEYRHETVESAPGVYEEKLPLAFRYLRVEGEAPSVVSCQASFHPVRYGGAFACSDPLLTQIWMTAAYTLRLCLHDFILDGIKRDRLPWAGDLAMSLSVNAYAFADAQIVRRTLTVLGRAGIARGDVNGIVDYSLWWVISHDLFQLYFDDPAYLLAEWPLIRAVLKDFMSRCADDGFLRPAADAWVFIDWAEFEKSSSLQIMWYWAQKAGARLAERMGDVDFGRELLARSEAFGKSLTVRAWDAEHGFWRSGLEGDAPPSRHANFFAVLSGLAISDQHAGIRAFLSDESVPAVGTPYMAGFECAALARLGNAEQALGKVRALWGAMIKRGATSFWESYDATKRGDEFYAFYGRPFANSLCHAWSAGPAWLLSAEIMGIRPLADGWKKFEVAPCLGDLTSAHACVPTPFGAIEVDCENGTIRIAVPDSTILVWRGREYPGPQTVIG